METAQLTVPNAVATIQPHQLAGMVQCKSDQILVVDSRTFCEYNTSHILNSVNVWSSKIRKKRLQQNSISIIDYLQQACHVALQDRCLTEIIVYDQSASCVSTIPVDSFLHVLLHKLRSSFDKICLLTGGYLEFHSLYPEFCEDSSQKASPLTSLSQPCMPVTKCGPTRILPFLFLGSQFDANNKQLLLEHNITYELNVSTSCPKPDFLQDTHFMRIAVNDNFSEKLLPHFSDAFRFIDKVREMGGRVLVHCLAGISRSATVAIAYVMKHQKLHYDEAYRYVKNRRPTISPNINFVGQLLELDRQLMGDGLIYRSPTAPLFYEHDLDLSPIDILRSSSSSCIDSCRQRASFSCQTSSSPSSALASLSLFSRLNSNEFISSSKLPSSPPITPPKSPYFFRSYSMTSQEESNKRDRDISSKVLSTDGQISNTGSNYTFSTTASFNVSSQSSEDSALTAQPICVIEVTHERAPLTYVDVQSIEPMVVRETEVIATSIGRSNSEGESGNQGPLLTFAARANHPPTSEENNNLCAPSIATPPMAPKSPGTLPKKIETKHLPRSYSSSETHLNTRRLLESQNDVDNSSETCTRKSYSSDEIGKGFQPSNQTYPTSLFRENVITSAPSELARCDSWSTSGLGSEISDWDSLQDDNSSILTDDTQGPFDAVFADVYPGEWQESPLKKLTSSSSLKDHEFCEANKRVKMMDSRHPARQLRRQHRNVYYTSSLNDTKSTTSQSITSSPTPRPVSLPGVTGSYITGISAVDSNSNIDMGVEMDDNLDTDWQSEKEHETVQFEPLPESLRSNSVTEHNASVIYRTTGTNPQFSKERGTSFRDPKDDCESQRGLLSRRISKGSSGQYLSKIKIVKQSLKDLGASTSPELSSSPLSAVLKITSPECSDSQMRNDTNLLEDKWKTWDSEFHKKIKNIQSKVSSWDTDADAEIEIAPVRDKMAGFNLAQELMQSMEDLLETEINDIKRQASALSTKFGLHTTSSASTPVALSKERPTVTADILSKPGIIDPCSNRSTISFCPSLQQGIVRSGKLKNIHERTTSSIKFEPDFSTPTASTPLRKRKDATNKLAFHRAKSEPVDEGLYRARSCPGIPQDKDDEPQRIVLRHSKPCGGNRSELNRYSCGALDSMLSPFESCPDIGKLKRMLVDSTSSGNSSTHSSFNRLLQVS